MNTQPAPLPSDAPRSGTSTPLQPSLQFADNVVKISGSDDHDFDKDELATCYPKKNEEQMESIDMVADIITKPLGKDRHSRLSELMGLKLVPRSATPSAVEDSSQLGKWKREAKIAEGNV